jgi:hypothetical protein
LRHVIAEAFCHVRHPAYAYIHLASTPDLPSEVSQFRPPMNILLLVGTIVA